MTCFLITFKKANDKNSLNRVRGIAKKEAAPKVK
jgi:hypothetical protein